MKRLTGSVIALMLIASGCSDGKKEKKEEQVKAIPDFKTVAPEVIPTLVETPVVEEVDPFANFPAVRFYERNPGFAADHIPLYQSPHLSVGVRTNNRFDVLTYSRMSDFNNYSVQSYVQVSDDPMVKALLGGQRICQTTQDPFSTRLQSRLVAGLVSEQDDPLLYCESTLTPNEIKDWEQQRTGINHVQLISKQKERFMSVLISAYTSIVDQATTRSTFQEMCGRGLPPVPTNINPNQPFPNGAFSRGNPADIIGAYNFVPVSQGIFPGDINTAFVEFCTTTKSFPSYNQFGHETRTPANMIVAHYNFVPEMNPDRTISVTMMSEAFSTLQDVNRLMAEISRVSMEVMHQY